MSKTKYMNRLEKVIEGIRLTAEKMGIHPSEVTKAHFQKHVDNVSSWDIREVGGIAAVKKSHFPIVTKDLVTIREQKETAKYISDLEKKIGDKEHFEREILKNINNIVTPKTVKAYTTPKTKKKKMHREIVMMLNDVHYGLRVDSVEVGGVNSFDWKEAGRRTALFTKQAIDYKADKRDEVECLHVILNGDIVQGIIHDLTARTAHLLVHQINGAVHILSHMITHLASNYKKVVVHGVSGNHDDAVHRREGGRVLSHKYDSYTNMVYYSLSAMFRDQSNVDFNFPKSLYGTIDLPSGRICYTHGDTMFSSALGNPSKRLNTSSLGDLLSRFNMGESEKGNPKIKLFMFGHVHSHAELTTFDGTRVMVAPSLSGVDAFASSLAINHNQIGQIMFESTKDYLIGDKRLVELTNADDDSKLDKIIPVFKNELSYEGK